MVRGTQEVDGGAQRPVLLLTTGSKGDVVTVAAPVLAACFAFVTQSVQENIQQGKYGTCSCAGIVLFIDNAPKRKGAMKPTIFVPIVRANTVRPSVHAHACEPRTCGVHGVQIRGQSKQEDIVRVSVETLPVLIELLLNGREFVGKKQDVMFDGKTVHLLQPEELGEDSQSLESLVWLFAEVSDVRSLTGALKSAISQDIEQYLQGYGLLQRRHAQRADSGTQVMKILHFGDAPADVDATQRSYAESNTKKQLQILADEDRKQLEYIQRPEFTSMTATGVLPNVPACVAAVSAGVRVPSPSPPPVVGVRLPRRPPAPGGGEVTALATAGGRGQTAPPSTRPWRWRGDCPRHRQCLGKFNAPSTTVAVGGR